MGTEKRDRKKANRAARLAAEQAAETRARRLKTLRNLVLFAVGIVIVGVLLSLAACSSGESAEEVDAGAPTTGASSNLPSSTPGSGGGNVGPTTPTDEPEAPPAYGTGPCPPAEGVDEPVIDFADAPEQCIDPEKAYTATFTTTEGAFTVELLAAENPITVNNFVVLARYGYYDGTVLFRTEADTGIIQGGAPHTQSNTDQGPGYTIRDENLPFSSDDYGPGTLAMARTGLPHSAGAQFFLLATEGGRYLGDPAQLGDAAGTYAVFGRTVEGLEVLEAIAALDDGSRTPSRPVTLETVTITES